MVPVPNTTEHLCPENPTDLTPMDLWTALLEVARFLNLALTDDDMIEQ